MSKELSKFQRGKVILGLINNLKELPNKHDVYMDSYYSDAKLMKKIADRAGIRWDEWAEKGVINIAEEVSITLDDRIHKATLRLNGETRDRSMYSHDIEFKVDEKLKEACIEFEKKNIPSSGPCSTHIGEMFRAIQYIQYRAYNDGDLCWDPGSPSFMSYVYLRSQVDQLNYSNQSFNEDTGKYRFEFTDEFLLRHDCGQISDLIEDPLAQTANYIKYQLMDLMINGKLKDFENEFDSRDFKSLSGGYRY